MTGGNYSGCLGNNTFNPVKSVVGYLVTHMLKVPSPIFHLEAFTSIQLFEQVVYLWAQKKSYVFCEFRLHLGLSSFTNP